MRTASGSTCSGGPELFAAKGEFRLRALSLERFGLGAHLAAIERLKQTLADEGLFDAARKRPLPRFPRRIGLVTGTDAAAQAGRDHDDPHPLPACAHPRRGDAVQGPRAALGIVEALQAISREPGIDVVILTRGGGSFDDLLPFSDESVVRAVAACPVPVVSAVGHEQDTPLCDLAADVRASTPTAAGKLVVPDLESLAGRARSRGQLARALRAPADRTRARRPHAHAARRSSAARAGRSTGTRSGSRSCAIVCAGVPRSSSSAGARRSSARPASSRRSPRGRRSAAATRSCARATRVLRTRPQVEPGDRVDVELAEGALRRPRRGTCAVSELTFETAQQELEQIVERLERGNAGLDEAIKLWERGEELLRFCLARLETAEGKIEELAQRAADAAPLSPGADGG